MGVSHQGLRAGVSTSRGHALSVSRPVSRLPYYAATARLLLCCTLLLPGAVSAVDRQAVYRALGNQHQEKRNFSPACCASCRGAGAGLLVFGGPAPPPPHTPLQGGHSHGHATTMLTHHKCMLRSKIHTDGHYITTGYLLQATGKVL